MALILAAMVTAALPLIAEAPIVAEADRAVAAELAATVDDDLESSDPQEAARLLLRAVRWDPSRWDDYRSAMELLESFDPEAAARHAIAELHGQARFNKEDAALLSRLAKAAVNAVEDATWLEGANLTRAAAEQMAKFGSSKEVQTAKLWTEAGSAYATRGEWQAASDAYDQMQRLLVATENDRLKQAYRWDRIAGFHLDANQPTRAAFAIDQLREREGEAARLLVLQSRLALQLDEPLAAVEHAEQAIESLAGPGDETAEGAYAAFVESMHTANQSDRAAERLAKDAAADPDNIPLALAAIDARTNAGQFDQAWSACGKLIDKLATDLPVTSDQLGADSPADPTQLDLFADAVRRRLRLAAPTGRVREALEESSQWIERLGNLNLVWDDLAEQCREDAFRSEVSQWLNDHEANPKAPATKNLALTTIAYLAGRPDDVATHALAMLEQAHEQGVKAGEASATCVSWAANLLDDYSYDAANKLLDGTITLLDEKRDGAAIATLRAWLARGVVSQNEKSRGDDSAVADEAMHLIAAARRQTPDDGFVAYYAIFYSLYVGRSADAIAIGEEVFERWPAPDDESQFDSLRYRIASELFAAALLVRDEPGDADRAAELLEASLDRWPQSPMALTYLGWHDSRSPAGRERALRLLGDAVRDNPDRADSRGFLGVAQLRAGQIDKGIESLRQATSMADAETLSYWERDLFRYELAQALRANGRAEEAEVVESAAPPAE